MGKIKNTIKDLLKTEFNPATLIIENESFMHNVPENSESHFKIILASECFKDIPNVKRHQLIYKSLENVMNKIHALSIYAFDLDEIEKNPSVIESPDCANK
tara:strand:- start:4274 stop:4576 length:303 start_codon:yes stop_codon:yes gene_type:complete